MATEYENLLKKLIEERQARLADLKVRRGREKDIGKLTSEINFIEVELQRYQQSMSLFRTKGVPKVGRWGKAETRESTDEK